MFLQGRPLSKTNRSFLLPAVLINLWTALQACSTCMPCSSEFQDQNERSEEFLWTDSNFLYTIHLNGPIFAQKYMNVLGTCSLGAKVGFLREAFHENLTINAERLGRCENWALRGHQSCSFHTAAYYLQKILSNIEFWRLDGYVLLYCWRSFYWRLFPLCYVFKMCAYENLNTCKKYFALIYIILMLSLPVLTWARYTNVLTSYKIPSGRLFWQSILLTNS